MSATEQATGPARRGESLAGEGRWSEAAAAFREAVALAPDDAVLHNNLAVALFQSARLDEAVVAFGRAIELDPAHLPAHAGLAFALISKGDQAGAIEQFRAVVRLDPRNVQARMALFQLLQVAQQRDEALAHQLAALEVCRLFTQPCVGGAPRATILVLKAPGDLQTNIPLDLLFDRAHYTLHDLYFVAGHAAPAQGELPPYDVVFNAISESERALPALAAAEAFTAAQSKPALNDPARVRRLSRDGAARLFADIPGCHFPPTARLTRTELLAASSPLDALRSRGMALPVVIRPIESHAGVDLARIETAGELADYLARVEPPGYYVAPFVDYRSPDGFYRKYRVMFVDGVPYPCHLAISERWMIHYLNADTPNFVWMRAEEERFLADLSNVFTGAAVDALRAIAARCGLDYAGMDCTLDAEGRVLVFEIDAAMLVHLWDPIEIYPYKHRYVPRIFRAVEALVDRRIGRSAAAGATTAND
ncbi:MAG TPA: tetratricopeptide repeat protein [Candidatus Sulfotelmatobacter sp.]|nr:tetratricopeptide repeat protein [Candidatus Sulfotelmatobacter sp.]